MTTTETDHRGPAVNITEVRRALQVLRPDLDYASDIGTAGEQVMCRGDLVETLSNLLPDDSPVKSEIEVAKDIALTRCSGWFVLQTTSLKTLIAAGTAKLEKQP